MFHVKWAFGKMKKSSKYVIAGITAVAVAFSVGFYVSPSFLVQSDSDHVQTLGIGANVVVEAYHEDGTLFQKWEGHNDLDVFARNALVSCITGVSATPTGYNSCILNIDDLRIQFISQDTFTTGFLQQAATLTLLPTGCSTTSISSVCNGWELVSTFDFNAAAGFVSCTPTVDCIDVNAASAVDLGTSTKFFNTVLIIPAIPIVPNDRLVVTMTFDVPP